MSQQQPFGYSQVPLDPSFRKAAVNAVAVIPLLSSHNDGDNKRGDLVDTTPSKTHSAQSHADLMDALHRHQTCSSSTSPSDSSDLLLVVPNSTLTRPGEWRYNDTPLRAFHWQHGCQRLLIHDGRPEHSRHAHDSLLNAATRNWIDLLPSRRTAAVVGVLNMHDCQTVADLHRAEEELQQWAVRYATPPYEVTAHGRNFERDYPVQRLFVYDSFDEACQKIDLNQSRMSILAFPPADEAHAPMMDLHMNIVISDLTVAIFQALEEKIRDSHEVTAKEQGLIGSGSGAGTSSGGSSGGKASTLIARSTISRYMSGGSVDNDTPTNAISSNTNEEEPVNKSARNLGIGQLASLVSPESKLAKESPPHAISSTTSRSSSFGSVGGSGGGGDTPPTSSTGGTRPDSGERTSETVSSSISNRYQQKLPKLPLLLTPLDHADLLRDYPSQLAARDAEAVRRRDVGRREKFCGDLCLLAGSPLDAYERYLKAAELASSNNKSTGVVDPLWHASALEGCAAAHIAMAEAGGYSVDEYLENNFQLPEEIMALAKEDASKRQTAASSKQTLPEVVFALCEEALNILSRNEKLCHLFAELLLKLAYYSANESEAHLRCRWGEGEGCYAGEQGDPPRWERTSVGKLTFEPLKSKEGDMITINTHNRIRRVSELLTTAASVGSLDPATRVDVAVRSARMCLVGVKPTHWDGPEADRLKLPRKAAYCTAMAAATVSSARSDGSRQTARDLWLLATQLYSSKANGVDGAGGYYGWATLRAFCFDCLSMQGNCKLSLEACGQLLSILGDLEPDLPLELDEGSARPGSKNDDSKRSGEKGSEEASDNTAVQDDKDLQEAITSAGQFAKNLRSSYSTFTSSNASTFISNESKWAYSNDPVPSVDIPLSEMSTISLTSVWPKMDYDIASAAQKRCLARTAALQRAIATSSGSDTDASSFYGFDVEALPMYISSAMAIHAEPSLELECIQKRDEQADQGAMATFFNPYANKKSGNATAKVAEDEERAMLIRFGNRLALPIEVQRSQLEFMNDGGGRVKAAALSFVVPPKATGFTVHFPFTVLSKTTDSTGSDAVDGDTFEVKGLDLTCFGRSFFLPINTLNHAAEHPRTRNLPDSAATYPHSVASKSNDDSLEVKPKIQVYPCQPKLQICMAETGAPAENIIVSLSAGEVLSLPSFRLNNYLGPSSKGKIESLEILSTLSGSSNRKLFDSSSDRAVDESENEFVRDLIYETNPPPLKIRVLQCDLNLDCVNGMESNGNGGNNVTFQIAAAHNLSEKMPDGTSFQLNFRYRGPYGAKTEVWRKREVTIRVLHTKGPRISSIAFRPDLADDSAFADLNFKQGPRKNAEKSSKTSDSGPADLTLDRAFLLERLGLDSDVSVCGSASYFLLSVSNDTRSVLTVSRPDGPVGGFASCPLPTMIVRPGVSAKIPIVMPRISRADENGDPADVIEKFIAETSLVWLSHKGGESGPVKARGHIRIPPSCLWDIINRQPSFLSQICTPPCRIDLFVGDKVSPKSNVTVALGKPVDVSVDVSLESWVPQHSIQDCNMTMEFRCSRKDRSQVEMSVNRREYVWAGKLRRRSDLSGNGSKSHHARIAFCSSGQFVVSACVRIYRSSSSSGSGDVPEEIWWAPFAQTVMVKESTA